MKKCKTTFEMMTKSTPWDVAFKGWYITRVCDVGHTLFF